jgi:hypothetical protein
MPIPVPRTASVATVVAGALFLTPAGAVGKRAQGTGSALERFRPALAQVGLAGSLGEQVAIRWLGTGFLAGRPCTVVTAKHILQGVDRTLLVVNVPSAGDADRILTLPAGTVVEDPEKDIALLELGGLPGSPCGGPRPERLSVAPAFRARAWTGEPVLVAGFPGLEGQQPRGVPILREGIIASAELELNGAPMLLLDIAGVPGFSGAPVILKATGEVIGVVFGPGRTDRNYDLEWATPISSGDLKQLGEGSR